VADIMQARPGTTMELAGRERVRADGTEGAGYRTFSARVPATLTAAGGAFVVMGALGASLRASAILRHGSDPITVRTSMGFSSSAGWAIAVAGLVLAVSMLAWLRRNRAVKVVPVLLTAAVAVVVALRLTGLNDRAAAWATDAKAVHRYLGFHAGLGWGAWALLAGAILAGFGVLVGVLREIDVRKGFGS